MFIMTSRQLLKTPNMRRESIVQNIAVRYGIKNRFVGEKRFPLNLLQFCCAHYSKTGQKSEPKVILL